MHIVSIVLIIFKNKTQEFKKIIGSFNDDNNNPIKCLTNILMKNNYMFQNKKYI